MREGETDLLREVFKENYDMKIEIVDAQEEFLKALEGVTDPETKRKAIGETFIRVFEKEAKKIGAKIAFRRESYCKGYSYKKTDYSVVYFKKVCDRLKIPLSYEKSFGGSDANSFIAHGISVLNIGEGSKYPHTLREQVSEKDLFKLVELIATYITL